MLTTHWLAHLKRLSTWRMQRGHGTRRIRSGNRWSARRVQSSQIEVLEDRALLSWLAQVPASVATGSAATSEINGCVQVVVAKPGDADTVYIGAVNGGIWKTTNATAATPTWTPLTDSLPSQSIGALEFDRTDGTSQTLLAGTGRFSSFSSRGDDTVGLCYTTNGGTSWSQISDALLINQHFTGVFVRGATMLAGGGSGLFRSTNTGGNWANISGTGGLSADSVLDVVTSPSNTSRVYVSLGGSNAGVYQSNDSGASWSNISSGITGLSASSNKIEMAVYNDGTTSVVSVGVINSSVLAGLFRSVNGAAFTALDVPRVNPSAQGDIHFAIAAAPSNSNIIYVGGDAGAFSLCRLDASLAPGSQVTAIAGGSSKVRMSTIAKRSSMPTAI